MHVRKITVIVLTLVLVAAPAAAFDSAADTGRDDGSGGWSAWFDDLVDQVRDLALRLGGQPDAADGDTDLGVLPPGDQDALRSFGREDAEIGGGADPDG